VLSVMDDAGGIVVPLADAALELAVALAVAALAAALVPSSEPPPPPQALKR